jgi:hypothetical protein
MSNCCCCGKFLTAWTIIEEEPTPVGTVQLQLWTTLLVQNLYNATQADTLASTLQQKVPNSSTLCIGKALHMSTQICQTLIQKPVV